MDWIRQFEERSNCNNLIYMTIIHCAIGDRGSDEEVCWQFFVGNRMHDVNCVVEGIHVVVAAGDIECGQVAVAMGVIEGSHVVVVEGDVIVEGHVIVV